MKLLTASTALLLAVALVYVLRRGTDDRVVKIPEWVYNPYVDVVVSETARPGISRMPRTLEESIARVRKDTRNRAGQEAVHR